MQLARLPPTLDQYLKLEAQREKRLRKRRQRHAAQRGDEDGGVDHALQFHLADRTEDPTDMALGAAAPRPWVGTAPIASGTTPASSAGEARAEAGAAADRGATVPAAPANVSKDEAREWEAYHRFCARSELFALLEASQDAEARIEARLEEQLRSISAAAEGSRQAVGGGEAVLHLETELDEVRRMNSEQVLAMIAEYNPRPAVPKAKHDPELERLTAMMPSPAAIIAEVEAAVAEGKPLDMSALRAAPEPTVEPLPVNVPRPASEASPPEKTRPQQPALVMPGIDVAPRMEKVARGDETNSLPLKDLPVMRPVDQDGSLYINSSLRGTVDDHTAAMDLGFPTLEVRRKNCAQCESANDRLVRVRSSIGGRKWTRRGTSCPGSGPRATARSRIKEASGLACATRRVSGTRLAVARRQREATRQSPGASARRATKRGLPWRQAAAYSMSPPPMSRRLTRMRSWETHTW